MQPYRSTGCAPSEGQDGLRDLRLVQEALGHSSPNVTVVYAAYEVTQTAGAMAAVAAALEEAAG